MNGWRLFGWIAAFESALFAVALAAFGSDEAGLRALVRFTVRVSFLVFIAVYAAAPLRRLYPSPATRWIARNRRYLGVCFAWAHGLHALAIALLVVLLGDAFERRPVTTVGGGYAYLLIAAMAATSFDRSARWLGPKRWALLHRFGLHTLWLIFAVSWTRAVFRSPLYVPFAVVTWVTAALRLAALLARGRSAEPVATPA